MIRRVVTLGGPPGSGKSTAGRLVAEALRLELRSAGELFRAEAVRHGLTLEAFGAYALAHPEVDRALDAAMQALAAPGRILEGRLQGALCRRAGTPVHAIVVTASEAERARRVAGRDHLAVEEALRRIREREESERTRYRSFYGIDLGAAPSDLTVDSTDLAPGAVAQAILDFLRAAETGP
ncbi:MAG TPA: cytidylate kinase family protein [Thermoplasmata archaeon]|nr:cytidylate kinase family protein [Thermoplasmata archaeon]